MRISRRRFLATAGAGMLGLAGYYAYDHSYRGLVVSIIRDRLSFLNLGEVDLLRFADEYVADKGTFGMRGRLFALAYPVVERAGFLNPRPEDSEKFEERVSARFLLSTDFFWTDSDETRDIRYVAYNHPHHRACGHPWAQLD